MDKATQKYFLNYLASATGSQREQSRENLLLACRGVCKSWNKYILSLDAFREWDEKQKEIRKLLLYDDKVYDENYYRRLVLQNSLQGQDQVFKKTTMPGVQFCFSDLDEETMLFIVDKSIPLDVRIFFCEYFRRPNVIVSLYPANFIKSVSSQQASYLRQKLLIDTTLSGVLLFTPLCYSKHYRVNLKDKQYVNVLCYTNIIDLNLESEFPAMDERFVVFEIPVSNMDGEEHFTEIQEFLSFKTEELIDADIHEITQNVQSIVHGFETLLENHYHNL
jgi:hypothetical protein